MVFNVVTHNRDDHTKQTSLSMDRRGRWTLSPAYDLTWSEGPGGEHCMAVAGAGDPGPDDLLAAARRCGIDAADARRVIEEVTGVVTSRWHELAGELAISAGMTRRIADWVARWAVES
jgi:serine/threonine-protein kinase HipA